MWGWLINQAELGRVPDPWVRWGIRRLCRERLRELRALAGVDEGAYESRFIELLASTSGLALDTDKANQQHYEVPAAFFKLVLGPHLKYSGCWFPSGRESLGEAESLALAATAEHAQLADGQDILELGAGWGSLALWMARRYPKASITSVSNAHSQRDYIMGVARAEGLTNLEVITQDINTFSVDRRFDRVVSVEMFEHVRNWPALLRRVRQWIRDDGRLFVHVFCHRRVPYLFEDGGDQDWMARWFFSGGLMPSHDLLLRCAADFDPVSSWFQPGRHYGLTAEAWLKNLDTHHREVRAMMAATHGSDQARQWVGRWRLFFLACAELFGFEGGEEWGVVHHLLRPR